MNPCSRNAPPSRSTTSGSKPDIDKRRRDGPQQRAELIARHPELRQTPENCVSLGRSANGRFQFNAFRNAAVSPSRVSGKSSCTLRRGRPDDADSGRIGHFGDRRNPGDRFLRKAAERVRHGADQLAVDVDRAAAHAGNHAGMGQWTAFELGENQVAVCADDVFEHADDVDLEFLDVRAVEDGPADADHPRPDVCDAHRGGGAGEKDGGNDREPRERREARYDQPDNSHGFRSHCRGEVLTGQGEMGDRLDTCRRRLILSRFLVMGCRSFCLGPRSSSPLSAWRWYWGSTEEASALA